ncbi:MAG: hypothetical protein FD138_2566 [Planctomycetota bacterium]|nr:MAG: hypothetical protein FD138_2566 [Planctomycetota bacterium]
MRRSEDLTALLHAWEYDEGRSVRRVRAKDGREVLQVRLPLGLEQYEFNGRPDGLKPEGEESWLHYYKKKVQVFREEFVLTKSDCEKLQSEGVLYYYRYLLFFQLGEYALCTRDTQRNLRLLDFVGENADSETAESLLQYRPYILRMNIMARALQDVKDGGNKRAAIRKLERGIEEIQGLTAPGKSPIFDLERERSVRSIEELVRQFREQIPLSRRDRLRQQMEEAISREDYEKAATLRDQLRKISKR